jgi:hypothetical protein
MEVLLMWSLLHKFIYVSPLDPSYFQTGWDDFLRITKLKWKSYSPLQARFILSNQKKMSTIRASLCMGTILYIQDMDNMNIKLWIVYTSIC